MSGKAVILARGLGTRMRTADSGAPLAAEQAAAASAGLKAMMPVGRPFLDFALSALADAGFEQACLVIGPEHEAIRTHVAGRGLRRIAVSFAVQEQPIGTADAVLAARDFVGLDRFLVVNGDNYYPVPVLAAMRAQSETAVAAFSRAALIADGHIPPERIERFSVLDIAPDGYLRRIVEKPDPAEIAALGSDPRIGMNCWLFESSIFEACREVTPSSRGELELPLAVQHAIEAHHLRVRAVPADLPVLDLSSRGDVAAVTARLRDVSVRP